VFRIGFGIHYTVRWRTPEFYWTFANCQYLTSPALHRYVYRSENNVRYIGRTRYAGSVDVRGGGVVSRGPDRGFVERRGNTRIDLTQVVDVRDRQSERIVREGDRQRIEVYRPRIEPRSEEMTVDRPERLGQSDRKISIDARSTDVGVREAVRRSPGQEQRGVEMRTQEETGVTRGVPRTTGRDDRAVERRSSPAEVRPEPQKNKGKSVDRKEGERSPEEQRSRQAPQRQVAPGIERKTEPPPDAKSQPRVRQEEKKSEAPGRVMPRPEAPRQERSEQPRGGSGRRRDAP
jgi:hypothetical protein